MVEALFLPQLSKELKSVQCKVQFLLPHTTHSTDFYHPICWRQSLLAVSLGNRVTYDCCTPQNNLDDKDKSKDNLDDNLDDKDLRNRRFQHG